MEFTIFPQLPTELRLMIWERVPPPRRLVGQIACPGCYYSGRPRIGIPELPGLKRICTQQRLHEDCYLRFVDVTKNNHHAVFPPLHACRESRNVWLRRYHAVISRYSTPVLLDGSQVSGGQQRQRFGVPFINYETDIVAVFRLYSELEVGTNIHGDPRAILDPFVGLDRTRIRHIAIGEDAESVGLTAILLGLQGSLPSLETLSILTFGPGSNFTLGYGTDDEQRERAQMNPETATIRHCKMADIPERAVDSFFGKERPFRRHFEPRPHVKPLRCYREMLKAWLWHVEHLGEIRVQVQGQNMFLFEDFVIGEDGSNPDPSARCPFVGIAGCGPTGHTHSEMMAWVPRFEIRHLFLYDKADSNIIEAF